MKLKRREMRQEGMLPKKLKTAHERHGTALLLREENKENPEFFIFGGKRHVYAYPYDYLAWAKAKWFGYTLRK